MKHVIRRVSLCLSISLYLSVSSNSALAVDWSLNSSLSETVELNTNQFLRTMLAGGTLGSYSTITANAEAKTPTSRFIFDGDINYQKYWGPGTEGLPQTEFRQDGVKARYEITGKDPTDLSYAESSFRETSTALAILNSLGVATSAQGFIDASTLRAGIERNLTAMDFATLSGRLTHTNYDPSSGGTAFTDSSVVGTWRHRLTSNTALTASSEVERLNFDNSTNTNITILRDMAGIDTSLSPVLSFRGSWGIGYIKIDQIGLSSSTPITTTGSPPITTTASPGSIADFITDMTLTYRMLKNTTLTVYGNQSISPSVIGSLTKVTTIGTDLVHVINSRSQLSFDASASRQTSTASSDFYLGSITYRYQLARDWSSQLSYRYQYRTSAGSSAGGTFDPISGIPIVTSGTAPAHSNSIIVALTRNFSVLPHGN